MHYHQTTAGRKAYCTNKMRGGLSKTSTSYLPSMPTGPVSSPQHEYGTGPPRTRTPSVKSTTLPSFNTFLRTTFSQTTFSQTTYPQTTFPQITFPSESVLQPNHATLSPNAARTPNFTQSVMARREWTLSGKWLQNHGEPSKDSWPGRDSGGQGADVVENHSPELKILPDQQGKSWTLVNTTAGTKTPDTTTAGKAGTSSFPENHLHSTVQRTKRPACWHGDIQCNHLECQERNQILVNEGPDHYLL